MTHVDVQRQITTTVISSYWRSESGQEVCAALFFADPIHPYWLHPPLSVDVVQIYASIVSPGQQRWRHPLFQPVASPGPVAKHRWNVDRTQEQWCCCEICYFCGVKFHDLRKICHFVSTWIHVLPKIFVHCIYQPEASYNALQIKHFARYIKSWRKSFHQINYFTCMQKILFSLSKVHVYGNSKLALRKVIWFNSHYSYEFLSIGI